MGKIIFRGSQCGHCSRAIAANALGLSPERIDPKHGVAFGIGHALEGVGLDLAKLLGWELRERRHDNDLEHVLPGGDSWDILCHLDGLGRKNGAQVVVEVKTMGHYAGFQDAVTEGIHTSHPSYYDQSQAYMAASKRESTLFVLLDKDDPIYSLAAALKNEAIIDGWTYPQILDRIVRNNKVDFQLVEHDESRVSEIIEKHHRISESILSSRLPEPEDQNCGWCLYSDLCEHVLTPEDIGTLVISGEEHPEADQLVRDYRQVQDEAKGAEEKRKDLARKLQTILKDQGAKRIISSVGTFSLIVNKGRKTLDKERIPVEVLAEAMVVGSPYVSTRFVPSKGGNT